VSCSNAAKTRNPLKFAGVPQTTGPISAASGPKFTIWGREEILLVNKFLPDCRQRLVALSTYRRYTNNCIYLSIYLNALVGKIQPDKVARWCPYGDFLAIVWGFCISTEPHAARFILNLR